MHCGSWFSFTGIILFTGSRRETWNVYLSDRLPFRNLTFSAVTKQIVRIFDIMTESEKTYGGTAKEEFSRSSPTAVNLCSFMSVPSCLLFSSFCLQPALQTGCLFLGLQSVLSKVPRLDWGEAVDPSHFWQLLLRPTHSCTRTHAYTYTHSHTSIFVYYFVSYAHL